MNGYSNARNLAKLYGIVANGGKTKEGVLLSQKAIETLKQPLTSGDSLDKIINLTLGYGVVVMTDERVRNITGLSIFIMYETLCWCIVTSMLMIAMYRK